MPTKKRKLLDGFIDPLTIATVAIAAITVIGTMVATRVVQQSSENRSEAAAICPGIDSKTKCNSTCANGYHCKWSLNNGCKKTETKCDSNPPPPTACTTSICTAYNEFVECVNGTFYNRGVKNPCPPSSSSPTTAPNNPPTSTPKPAATTKPTVAPTSSSNCRYVGSTFVCPTSTPKPTASSTPKPAATTKPTVAPTSSSNCRYVGSTFVCPTSTPKPPTSAACKTYGRCGYNEECCVSLGYKCTNWTCQKTSVPVPTKDPNACKPGSACNSYQGKAPRWCNGSLINIDCYSTLCSSAGKCDGNQVCPCPPTPTAKPGACPYNLGDRCTSSKDCTYCKNDTAYWCGPDGADIRTQFRSKSCGGLGCDTATGKCNLTPTLAPTKDPNACKPGSACNSYQGKAPRWCNGSLINIDCYSTLCSSAGKCDGNQVCPCPPTPTAKPGACPYNLGDRCTSSKDCTYCKNDTAYWCGPDGADIRTQFRSKSCGGLGCDTATGKCNLTPTLAPTKDPNACKPGSACNSYQGKAPRWCNGSLINIDCYSTLCSSAGKCDGNQVCPCPPTPTAKPGACPYNLGDRCTSSKDCTYCKNDTAYWCGPDGADIRTQFRSKSCGGLGCDPETGKCTEPVGTTTNQSVSIDHPTVTACEPPGSSCLIPAPNNECNAECYYQGTCSQESSCEIKYTNLICDPCPQTTTTATTPPATTFLQRVGSFFVNLFSL